MPTLNIQGQKIKVSDEFLQLSPEEQNATVQQIAQQLGVQPQTSTPQPAPAMPQDGTIFDAAAQGVFGLGDEFAGAAGASANTLANLFGAGTGDTFGKAYRDIRDDARNKAQSFATRNPKTALAAELGTGLLTGGAAAARLGALKAGTSLSKLRNVGALEGALVGAGKSTAEDAAGIAKDTAVGGILGGTTAMAAPTLTRAAGGLLRKTAGGVGGAADNLYQSAVRKLENAGVSLTTGQKAGSTGVKAAETTLGGSLFGGAVKDTLQTQHQQLQKKLFKMAGFKSEDVADGLLTPEALERTAKRFGSRYTSALKGKKIDLSSDEFLEDLAAVEAKHAELISVEQRGAVHSIISDLLDKATKKPLSGKEYQRLRSLMGRRQRQNVATNPTLSDLYGGLKNSLDDAFERGTGSTKKLNTEYAHFKQLEGLFERNAGAKDNRLPLATLAKLARKSPGSEEWKDLTLAAYQVLGDMTANSGTASRALNFSPLFTAMADPSMGLASAAAPLAASNVLSRGVGAGALRGTQQLANRGTNAVSQLGRLSDPAGLLASPLLPLLSADP